MLKRTININNNNLKKNPIKVDKIKSLKFSMVGLFVFDITCFQF